MQRYIVTIFKNNAGRWGIKHPSSTIHPKDYASREYACKVCDREGWLFKFN